MIENGKYYERCRDCAGPIKELLRSSRQDVCDDCWGRREWLVKNINKYGADPRFLKIQRAMANHTGTAKKQIIALQNSYHQPEQEVVDFVKEHISCQSPHYIELRLNTKDWQDFLAERGLK